MTLPDNARERLHQRGITDAAIERARIRAHVRYDRDGWAYPIAPAGPAVRWKACPDGQEPRYAWLPSRPADTRLYDPAGDLAQHVAAADGVLILATGEPDVWACWSAGVYNVTCSLLGEGSIPTWLADELRALAVRVVRYYPDRDKAGQTAVPKLAAALAGTGVELDVRALPGDLKSKADLNKLLIDSGRSAFAAALEACPPQVVELPAPPKPKRKAVYTAPPSADWEAYRAAVDQAVPDEWKQGKRNAKGFYRNFMCPWHQDEKTPSAGYNPESMTVHCFGGGCGDHNIHEIAELLGLPPYESSRRRDNSGTTAAYVAPHWNAPVGVPVTQGRRLRTLHRRVPVDDHGPAETVWFAWHEIPATLRYAPFTAAEFRRATIETGRNLSRDTVETGLKQLEAFDIVLLLSLEASGDNASRDKSSKVYQFRPWAEQLAAFERHYRYILREHAYQHAPDDVQPEFGDLESDQIARLDAARAPVYERWADARLEAAQKLGQGLTLLEGDAQRIREGRYRVVTLPPGELRNARAFRRALAAERLRQRGGDGVRLGRLACELGVAPKTVRRMTEEADLGVVLIEQTVTLALEDLNDYQRDNLPYLTVGKPAEGMVTLKAEPRVMLREYAAETDCTAHDERVRAKQEAAAQRAAEAAPPPAPDERGEEAPPPPPPVRRVTIYADYSDAHKLRQLLWTPGAMDLPRYDAEGVYYTPDELWRMMADAPPAPEERAVFEHLVTQAALGKGGDMGTFTVHSEPREREGNEPQESTMGDHTPDTGITTRDGDVVGQSEGRGDRIALGRGERTRGDGPGDAHDATTVRPLSCPAMVGDGVVSDRDSRGRKDSREGISRTDRGDSSQNRQAAACAEKESPAGHVWALNWNIAKRRQTWCPPPGVDFLLDFCVAELGGVVVEAPAAVGKPHSDNRNEGQQSAISPPIWGSE